MYFHPILPPICFLDPDSPKIEINLKFKKKIIYYPHQLSNSFQQILNHDQGILLSRNIPKKVFWNAMPKYGNLDSNSWKIVILEKKFNDCYQISNTLPTSPQPLSGDYLNPKYTQKRVFGPLCPNTIIWTQTPQKLRFLKKFSMTVINLVIRF